MPGPGPVGLPKCDLTEYYHRLLETPPLFSRAARGGASLAARDLMRVSPSRVPLEPPGKPQSHELAEEKHEYTSALRDPLFRIHEPLASWLTVILMARYRTGSSLFGLYHRLQFPFRD